VHLALFAVESEQHDADGVLVAVFAVVAHQHGLTLGHALSGERERTFERGLLRIHPERRLSSPAAFDGGEAR
jgi:hypothetical protein